MTNSDLNHITLVESNATYGNSGGPVFSMHEKGELVGVLVAGYDDINTGIDPITKQTFTTKSRAGVSVIEKAEYVRKLIRFFQLQLDEYKKKETKRK